MSMQKESEVDYFIFLGDKDRKAPRGIQCRDLRATNWGLALLVAIATVFHSRNSFSYDSDLWREGKNSS